LSIGSLSILWGFAELLLPSSRWHKTVRAALGLLLLSTALSAWPGIEIKEIELAATSEATAIDAASAMEKLLSAQLEGKIRADLGIEGIRVQVTVKGDQTGSFFPHKVTMKSDRPISEIEKESLIAMMKEELGLEPGNMVFRGGETHG